MAGERLQALVGWAERHGAVISDKLEFQYNEKGVTAVVTQDVQGFEQPQLAIPQELIISSRLSDRVFPRLAGDNAGIRLFVAKLKFDAGPTVVDGVDCKHKFAPYIDLLPVGAQTGSVFYYPEEKMEFLRGTNLFGSWKHKLRAVLDEWYAAVQAVDPRAEHTAFYRSFGRLSHRELRQQLLTCTRYTSFACYLWATVIFMSRSFPQYLVDGSARTSTMLLPLIDLLNHDNSTKISWIFQDGLFQLHNEMGFARGAEIFNNYGPKGNEELLMGYGFTVRDNPRDSVALRIKLPAEVVRQAALLGVRPPTLHDYTYSVVGTPSRGTSLAGTPSRGTSLAGTPSRGTSLAGTPSRGTSLAGQGEPEPAQLEDSLFFINQHQLVPPDLIRLLEVSEMVAHGEPAVSTRSRLAALAQYHAAIDHKLAQLPELCPNDTINNYICGQKLLYNKSIHECKRMEKLLLREHKARLLSFKKVLVKDSAFVHQVALPSRDYAELSYQNLAEPLAVLWLAYHHRRQHAQDEYAPPAWLLEILNACGPAAAGGPTVQPSFARQPPVGAEAVHAATAAFRRLHYVRISPDAEIVFVG